jgi:hypothetical protein
MKKPSIIFLVLASLLAPAVVAAQALDWQAVEKLAPNTRIWVKARHQTYCYFQSATGDRLVCNSLSEPPSLLNKETSHVFPRAEVREVHLAPQDDWDYSKGPLALMAAAGGGGGWDFAHQPNTFAGIELAALIPVSLDLQYDRIQGHSGFSTEGSAVIPAFRVPRFQPFSAKNFVKLYAEPGIGYRAGDGPFGGYSSAKVLVLLWNSPWKNDWTPYIEFQHRFPFESPLQGDNRITVGVIGYICGTCGFD